MTVSESSKKTVGDTLVEMDRRRKNRRLESETPEQPETSELKPRAKKQRRRQIDPTTCERDYNSEEIEFMHALDAYKRSSGRMFPTCSEILEVIRSLGYSRLGSCEQPAFDTTEQLVPHVTDTCEDD